MSTSVASLMINVGPLFGASAVMTAAVTAGMKLYAGAATLALAACGVLEQCKKAAPVMAKATEPDEYPFSAAVANPWDRDSGPVGL